MNDKPPRRHWPTEFQRRSLWTALTATSLLATGAISVFVIWVLARVLQFLQPVLVPIAFAGILAYLLEPLIRKLTERGTPRFRAMMWVWVGFHGLLLLLFLSVAVPTISQGSRIIRQKHQSWVQQVGNFVNATVDGIDSLVSRFSPRPAEKPAVTSSDTEPPPRTHLLEQGETLASVAALYGISPDELALANSGRAFAPGLILTLPERAQRQESSPADSDKRFVKDRLTAWVARHGGEITEGAVRFMGTAFQGFAGAFGYVVGFFLVPLYLYYFLKESDAIQRSWSDYLPLRASRFKVELVDCLNEINGYLIAFFRGQMLVSLIDGVLVGITLALIGLPYALLIGVFVALLGLIPYVGNILCWFAAVAISIAHFGQTDASGALVHQLWGIDEIWAYPLIVSAIFVVVQQINSLATAPRIVGDAVGLHPLTVIFSVLFWSLLIGGLLGALLAVPLTASVKVIFKRYIWERRVHPRIGAGSPYEVT